MRFPEFLARLVFPALYGAALALPTPAAADVAAARALAAEAMPRLTFPDPRPAPDAGFLAEAGAGDAQATLADYAGKPAVVNFWATWCAPCKAEMPSLQRLAQARPDLAVVTVAFGRHNPDAMRAFWEEAGIETLPLHLDADGALARAFGVKGLPHTILLDADGQVVAEMRGEAEWDGPAALSVLDALAE